MGPTDAPSPSARSTLARLLESTGVVSSSYVPMSTSPTLFPVRTGAAGACWGSFGARGRLWGAPIGAWRAEDGVDEPEGDAVLVAPPAEARQQPLAPADVAAVARHQKVQVGQRGAPVPRATRERGLVSSMRVGQ